MKLLARGLLKLLNLFCFTCWQYARWIRLLVLQHNTAKFGLTACLQLVYSTHQFPILSQQIVVLRRSGRLEELAPQERCSKMLRELSDLQIHLQVWVLQIHEWTLLFFRHGWGCSFFSCALTWECNLWPCDILFTPLLPHPSNHPLIPWLELLSSTVF